MGSIVFALSSERKSLLCTERGFDFDMFLWAVFSSRIFMRRNRGIRFFNRDKGFLLFLHAGNCRIIIYYYQDRN